MFQTLEKLGLFLAVLGAGIAGYLVYTHFAGTQIVCGISSCGVVNSSKYSYFLGFPVSMWGLGYYIVVMFLIALKQRRLLVLTTLGGVIFSAYLTYLEAFVINAWCQWCIMSAWIAVSLFIISIRLRSVSDVEISPPEAK